MKAIAIDTETTGTNLRHGAEVFAISCCNQKGDTWFWDWPVDPAIRRVRYDKADGSSNFPTEAWLKEWKAFVDLIFSYDKWVFHNAKFDLYALSRLGLNWEWDWIEDTILMSHVVNSLESHTLKDLAIKYLDISDDDQKELQAAIGVCCRKAAKDGYVPMGGKSAWNGWMPKWLDSQNTLLEDYCIRDSVRTVRLYQVFRERLKERSEFQFYQQHLRLLPVIYEMEATGVPVKPYAMARSIKDWEGRKVEAEGVASSFWNGDDFNVRSTGHVRQVLYKDLKLPVLKVTPGGKGSTDEETLKDLFTGSEGKAQLFVEALLRYRKSDTASKYLLGYQELTLRHGPGNHRLFPSVNQIGTHTTRFSYSNPNLQNVSKQAEIPLREVFGPTQGTFWYDIDYDQLELRILAVAAEERKMLEAFERGEDIHQWTADLCGIPRRPAKNANYAAVYGAGNWKLQQMTGIPNMGQLFRAAYPDLAIYTRKTIHTAESQSFVETLGGYPLVVPQDRSYAAVDYVIQGTAGEIVRNAMVELASFLPRKYPGVKLILNVHDELLFEVPNKYRRNKNLPLFLAQTMEAEGDKLGVHTPVSVSTVRSNWAKTEEIKL